MNKKNFLLIFKSSPHQTSNMQEALDMALAISACEQSISLLFTNDGILQLKTQQQTEAIGNKNYAETFKALALYDINNIYIDQASLTERNITHNDLLIAAQLVSGDETHNLFNQHEIILTF